MSHWLALNWPDKFRNKLNRTNQKETKKANLEQENNMRKTKQHTFQVNEEQSKFPFNCV